MDVATLGLQVNASSIDKAHASLDKLSGSAKKAESAAQKLSGTNTKLASTKNTVTSSTNELTQAENRLSAAQSRNTNAVKKYSTAVRGGGFHTANLGAQFNDIGVMLAAGQSPLMLALQQGTQVNQVLDQMGTSGVSRLAALRTAFLSVISPANLITIGIIAGGAALVQWGMNALSAGDDANELAEKLEKAQKSVKSLNSELRGIRLDVDDTELALIDAIAVQRQKISEAQDRANGLSGHALRSARTRLTTEIELLNTYENQLSSYRSGNEERETLKKIVDQTTESERLLGEQMLQTASQLNEANIIAEYLRAGVSATTLEALEFAGIDLANPIVDADAAATLLSIGLSDSQISALEIAGMDIASPISSAAAQAERLANELFRASRVGLRKQLSDEELLFSQDLTASPTTNAVENFDRLTAPKAPRKSGATKTNLPAISKAEREAQRIFNQNLREAEQWITKTRTALEAYKFELADLKELNELGFFKDNPEAYARAVQMVTKEFEEAQLQPFIQGIESISNSIGDAIANGQDLGETFKQTLKQIASSIISSGINGLLTQMFSVGIGGGGGIFSSLLGSLFSFDGGGFTGHGSRTGGIDGKGGFLAINHPNETIIDHTKAMPSVRMPSSQNQQPVQSIYSPVYNIDATGADAAAVARLERGLMERDRRFAKDVQAVNGVSQLRNVRA